MFHATLHVGSAALPVEFESDYAFTKWLGYLKDHGLATARLAGGSKNVIVFKESLGYIELDAEASGFKLG